MGATRGVLLRTDRLRLRPWTMSAADIARLTDPYSREEITRWVGGAPSVPPDELVARWAAVSALDERYGCWAIERPPSPVVAGTVLFKPLPSGVGEVEVGWHLHPDSWGRGYATEAARAVTERGFAQGVPEVYASCARETGRPWPSAHGWACSRSGVSGGGTPWSWTPSGCWRRPSWSDGKLSAGGRGPAGA